MADNNTYTLTLDCDWWFLHDPEAPKTYKVFKPRIEKIPVVQGQTVGVLPTPKRPGYEFLGWWMVVPDVWETKWVRTKDQLESNEQYPWDFDATYYAKWKAVPCTVDWDSNGGSDVGQPNPWHTFYDYPLGYINAEHVLPATALTGYDFVGWFTKRVGGVQAYPTTLVDGDMTLYAHWTRTMCSVTFVTGNGDVIPKKVVEYGTEVKLSPLHWTGYDHTGWNDGQYGNDDTACVTSDMEFTADWVAHEYDIVWKFNGHDEARTDEFKNVYTIDDDDYTLPTPNVPGYTFNGWTMHGLPATEIPHGSVGNRTFVANDWTPNEYTLTFDPDFPGASASTTTVTYDQPIDEVPDPPEREDYEFLGWFTTRTGGVQVHAGDVYRTASDSTYYAHWKKLVTTYTVKFFKNEPTAQGYMEDQTIKYGISTQLPPNRFWRSYTVSYIDRKEWPNQTDEEVEFKFIGWSTTPDGDVEYMDEEEVLDPVERVEGAELNLYAKWRNAQVVLGNPEHDGYYLDGWYTKEDITPEDDPEHYDPGERVGGPGQVVTIFGDMVLYAHWKAKSMRVYFDPDGGLGGGQREVGYNETIQDMPQATKEGENLIGWFALRDGGGEELTFDTKITSDRTYYAFWRIATVKIQFNGNGGHWK